jgi:hypothetical protein
MGLAGRTEIERLEVRRRAEQQPGRVGAPALVKGNLPAQSFHLGGPRLVRRPGLHRDQ